MQGMLHCWKNTPGQCIMLDDEETLSEAALGGSGYFRFPCYYFNVPGLLKNPD